jgi:hypothetical protein
VTASTCPACGHSTFIAKGDGGTCSRCGYASGEANRCPHCNAVARVEGSGVNAVCAVCGGPRIPASFGGETASNALREQKTHTGKARLASVSTVVQALFAAVATMIALAVMPASIMGKVIAIAIALVPILLALRSRSRATTSRGKAKEAGERAWQAAAEDVAAQTRGGITAPALAKSLGIEPAYAAKLLTSLAVHDRTRVDVGDDAEVVYSVAPDALVRVGDEAAETDREETTEAAPEPRGRAR